MASATARSTELRMFLDTTRKFAEAQASTTQLRTWWREGQGLDRPWWRQVTELGWTSLLVPEEHGGGSLTGEALLDLFALTEILGELAVPGPTNVLNSVLAALVHPKAQPGVDVRWLSELMAGERVATWAHPPATSLSAQPGRDGLLLNGTALAVEFGAHADLVLVRAATQERPVLVLIDTHAPGVTVRPTQSIDPARPFADLAVNDGRGTLVAQGPDVEPIVARLQQVLNVLQVAETVGGSGRVLDLATQWAFERYSFGRPLASYQALKHRYADLATHQHAARAIALRAARAVQDTEADAALLVSAAKSYVGEVSLEIMQDCAQLLGGLSQTMEHDLHLYLRRAMLARQTYGTPYEHRQVVASLLLDREAAA
ncbi:acyl-CoA dehydrogenase family protein [Kineosporia babensis]|uniref:Acyl-CoA/acyl-ACP dehydrogenase n=1 Tax=Kineosporia babensis TaxID=499548 RepID=A0A9X1NIZ8_9ACTN|nr:acyl-CoA dehydrogenase family protein [Kineosporia babensis]MCD5314464.1 acyl-CoA/acyl-ACP dehydrogenase [Kineosporia babensis]